MDKLVGEFYIEDNKAIKCKEVNYQFSTEKCSLYEVIRTEQGILLFLEEHAERLIKGLGYLNLKVDLKTIHGILNKLLSVNKNRAGNIKLLTRINSGIIQFITYYIPHSYPDRMQSKDGVNIISHFSERPDPSIKQVKISELIKEQIELKQKLQKAFEVLLVKSNGEVTECSKSNILFIKNDKVYTPPENSILKGITRDKILEILERSRVDIISRDISLNQIHSFQAAVITGTSPKVLPVKSIDKYSYNVNHPLVILMVTKYDKEYKDYIQSRIT